MKILVISGFLGAGKTTFIKALAKHTGREFAILENEYGSVGVDGDSLKDNIPPGKVNIWEMAEGCICCSMKGDFAASVLTIANTVDPEYLVIEPTGVGMLSSIIQSLKEIEYERMGTVMNGTDRNLRSCTETRLQKHIRLLYPRWSRLEIRRELCWKRSCGSGILMPGYLQRTIPRWSRTGGIVCWKRDMTGNC